MRKSHAERIREWKRRNGEPIRIGEDGEDPAIGLANLMCGKPMIPIQRAYFQDGGRYAAFKGPAGCGKTVINCAVGLSRALWIPGSVGVIAQHDYNHLLSSTFQTFEKMLRRLPTGVLLDRDKSPPMKLVINPIGGGEPSTIIFMGLKENLGGYEFNWAFIDEADKVEEKAVRLVDGRLRNEGGGYALRLAFNPPDKHHWLYTACTGRNHQDRQVGVAWLKLYEGKPNENPYIEDPNYYENLRRSYTPDMVQRLVDGEWGSTFDGQPVYREFNYNTHCKRGLISRFDPQRPLLRFWDFGYNHPYCCYAQVDWEGRLLTFRETVGHMMEATAFARKCKADTEIHFPNRGQVVDYGDPAVRQKKDTGSTLALLSREGITMRYRITTIEYGLQQVRQRLSLNIDGEPAMQFDTEGVPALIASLRGGYHLDDKGAKPVKDNVYDHAADAYRYGVVNALGLSINTPTYVPESIEYRPEFDH